MVYRALDGLAPDRIREYHSEIVVIILGATELGTTRICIEREHSFALTYND